MQLLGAKERSVDKEKELPNIPHSEPCGATGCRRERWEEYVYGLRLCKDCSE